MYHVEANLCECFVRAAVADIPWPPDEDTEGMPAALRSLIDALLSMDATRRPKPIGETSHLLKVAVSAVISKARSLSAALTMLGTTFFH